MSHFEKVKIVITPATNKLNQLARDSNLPNVVVYLGTVGTDFKLEI